MPTLPPDIAYYRSAVQHEIEELQARIISLQNEIDVLARRAADLVCCRKYADRFVESCQSVGEVLDYVPADEIVGELPERRSET